jgi:hypothetical protein
MVDRASQGIELAAARPAAPAEQYLDLPEIPSVAVFAKTLTYILSIVVIINVLIVASYFVINETRSEDIIKQWLCSEYKSCFAPAFPLTYVVTLLMALLALNMWPLLKLYVESIHFFHRQELAWKLAKEINSTNYTDVTPLVQSRRNWAADVVGKHQMRQAGSSGLTILFFIIISLFIALPWYAAIQKIPMIWWQPLFIYVLIGGPLVVDAIRLLRLILSLYGVSFGLAHVVQGSTLGVTSNRR